MRSFIEDPPSSSIRKKRGMTFPVRPEHVKASGDLLADRMQTDHALYRARRFGQASSGACPFFVTSTVNCVRCVFTDASAFVAFLAEYDQEFEFIFRKNDPNMSCEERINQLDEQIRRSRILLDRHSEQSGTREYKALKKPTFV